MMRWYFINSFYMLVVHFHSDSSGRENLQVLGDLVRAGTQQLGV